MGWGSVGRGAWSPSWASTHTDRGKGSKAGRSSKGAGGKYGKEVGKSQAWKQDEEGEVSSKKSGFYFDAEDDEEECPSPDYSSLRAERAGAKKAPAPKDPEKVKQELKLKKKIREVEELEKKEKSGQQLDVKQLEKIGSKTKLQEELQKLLGEASPSVDISQVDAGDHNGEIDMDELKRELQELEELKQELESEIANDGFVPAKGKGNGNPPTKKSAPTVSMRATRASKASAWENAAAVDNKQDRPPVFQRSCSRGWKPPDTNESDDLADLAVVFACCDTDCSGGLDVHELRFALNACGLFPEMDMIQEWMQDEEAISLEAFRKLVDAKLASAPSSMRRPRAIPYARRGVSFGQLACMNRVFVESGWLEQKCEQFNRDNKDRIEAGQVHSLGQNLYALDRFLIRPVTSPEPDSGTEVSKQLKDSAYLPDATHKVSFSELVNPRGVRVDYFVSHWWGHPFLDTMTALSRWSQDVYKRFEKPSIDAVVYWLCFLALNQHRAGEEVGSTPEEGPFNAALMQAHGAIMILDEAVRPFERIWCLYEVKRLTDLSKEFELICGLGQVGSLLKGDASDEAKEAVALIGQALEKVSAYGAGASNADDKFSIWHRVADPRFRKLPLETLKANTDLKDTTRRSPSKERRGGGPAFVDASFKRFDATIRGLLAAPLFQSSLKEEDPKTAVELATKYLALGAPFNGNDLQTLEKLGCNPCSLIVTVSRGNGLMVDWTLLQCAANFGHMTGMAYLVQNRADMEAKTRYGLTALHLASSNGQVAAAEYLLKHGACINVQTVEWRTELQGAALQGYDECVDLLLRYNANTEMTDKKGETVLHAAVAGGHLSVVERLLQHSANLEAESATGYTALHFAARDNHVEIAEFLFQWSAKVGKKQDLQRKRCRRGGSALDLAESKGHEPIAELLRSHTCEPAETPSEACSEVSDMRRVPTEHSAVSDRRREPPESVADEPSSVIEKLEKKKQTEAEALEAKRQAARERRQKREEKHYKF